MNRFPEHEPSEGAESLQEYLAGLVSQGETVSAADTFRIDIRRALKFLAEQGRQASGGLLYLLVVLYRHLGGAEVHWAPRRGNGQLNWTARVEPPPMSVHLQMAESALERADLELCWQESSVILGSTRRRLFGGGTEQAVLKELQELRPRLRFYPGLGQQALIETGESQVVQDSWSTELLCEETYQDGRLCIWKERDERGLLGWCIEGLTYYQRFRWPVRVVVFDDSLRVDMTLSKALLEERGYRWVARAERLLRRSLLRGRRRLPYRLRHDRPLTSEAPALCRFLDVPGLLRWQPIFERLECEDVFGYRWTVGDLLRHRQDAGAVLTVERPQKIDGQPSRRPPKPVLVWAGEVAHSLKALIDHRHSGEGYLYSLQEAARSRRQLERLWASRQVARRTHTNGALWLLSWAGEEHPFELICAGLSGGVRHRRVAGEPQGLRLLFLSETVDSDRLSWDREAFLLTVEMLSESWEHTPLSPIQVRAFLRSGEAEWLSVFFESASPSQAFFSAPCLEAVGDRLISLKALREQLRQTGELPFTSELSATLPDESPFSFVLRADPLLDLLGLPYREVGDQLRAQRWLEEGRQRWLATHQETRPAYAGEVASEVWSTARLRIAQLEDPAVRSFLTVWREGRILERAHLPEGPFGRGWEAYWVQDDFPAGPYFSGAEPRALSEALEQVSTRLKLVLEQRQPDNDARG